jgi:hypothetical protein
MQILCAYCGLVYTRITSKGTALPDAGVNIDKGLFLR